MNFQSQIGLTFYATVGRGELDLPVIKQVFSGASQQIIADSRSMARCRTPKLAARPLPPPVSHALQDTHRRGAEEVVGEGRGESKDRGKPITV